MSINFPIPPAPAIVLSAFPALNPVPPTPPAPPPPEPFPTEQVPPAYPKP